MQDGCRILGSGKYGKMAKKYQHHKLPSCLGYPKHEGKDEENLTHFFRHYREISSSLCNWYNVKELGGNSRRIGNFRMLLTNKVRKRKKAATQPAEGSGCLCKYEDVV